VLTATYPPAPDSHPGLNFAVRGAAWSLGLFGLVRLAWFETHALLPLTEIQARLAETGFGTPALPIQVTLACSGADALSLCAGAILAYRATWRARLGGAAAGIGLILALNTIRIGTLGRAAGSPSFDHLHLYLWPGLLTLAVAGYVFAWMRYADRPSPDTVSLAAAEPPRAEERAQTGRLTARFVGLTAGFLVLFTAASPLYLGSDMVISAGAFIAGAAAVLLGLIGVTASATANMLSTERGAFLVTQECIATPLIPVYLAAVAAYVKTWPHRAVALAAVVPVFVSLGIARLLVVALPASIASSPAFLIHAFSQLLLAAGLVCVAAVWRHGAGPAAWRRAVAGITLGGVIVYALGPLYSYAVGAAIGTPRDDPQGAILLLPGFQVGLYVALTVAAFVGWNWRVFVTGLAGLGASQVLLFAAGHFLARYADLTPHARDVRAWAVAAPLLVIAGIVAYGRSRR
jgi:exosortase/archaeosortase family protein